MPFSPLVAPNGQVLESERPGVLPREALPHFWHPQRWGVTLAPPRFRRDLHHLSPNAEVCLSPVHQRWLVWERAPHVTYQPLCPGWSLKFVWQRPSDEGYLPLDVRLLAAIYARLYRSQGGSPPEYFRRIERDIQDRKAKAKAATDAESRDMRRDLLDSYRIKNIGKGNKFALHHDGTIEPARGERDWRRELGSPVLEARE